MGMKGKLIASMEVKCGGHSVHDIFQTNTHHIPNISPNKVSQFDNHQDEILKVGSIVSWKYNDDGNEKFAKQVIEAIDPPTKSITWKVIEGDVLQLYNSFTVITSCDHQWTTVTLMYEKKTEDTPQPLTILGFFINVTNDIESHLLKK